MRTYYDLLNLRKDADKRDIKRAFHALAKQLHPDVSTDGGNFLEVLAAYETLIDDRKREAYNKMLAFRERSFKERPFAGPQFLPKNRVSFALSLKDIAFLQLPLRKGSHRRHGSLNPKGYHVCVSLTAAELLGGSMVEIDVPAHVLCPVCRGNRVHCTLCSSKGHVLRAVPVAVAIPGHLSHDEIFAFPLRTQKVRGYAYFMIDTLFVKVLIHQDAAQ